MRYYISFNLSYSLAELGEKATIPTATHHAAKGVYIDANNEREAIETAYNIMLKAIETLP